MKIILLGYGKMGKAIDAYCQTNTNHQVVLKIDDEAQSLLTSEHLKQGDVAIDFSSPEVAVKHIYACVNAGLPIVSGTTGWLEQWDEIVELVNSNNGSFFYSSNFSIGVNLFWQIVRQASHLLNDFEDYDAMIEETHHIHKKDAPSGTAITTADKMINQLNQYEKWQLDETKSDSELLIKSYRKDEVPGTHLVTFGCQIDEISIEHKAHSRQGFVAGAVKAAEFLVGKNGVFGMDEMLKEEK